MYKKHFLNFFTVILFFRLIFSQETVSYDELFSKFNYERENGNYENAEKLAVQIITNYELEPELSKEDFIDHLQFFGKFYLEIEEDSIANLLFFRSAKIIENEIIRFQKKLINSIKKLDEIYIANSESYDQNPYSLLIKEIGDTNRLNKVDSASISSYSIWFPEVRYLDFKKNLIKNMQFIDESAIELFC